MYSVHLQCTHLELMVISILLDLDTFCVFPPGFQQEVLDLLDLPGHLGTRMLCNEMIGYYISLPIQMSSVPTTDEMLLKNI